MHIVMLIVSGTWFDKLTMSGFCSGRAGFTPGIDFTISLCNRPRERSGQLRLNHINPATVVPAKAGIQEISRKRAGRLLRILDSGFRRNDGVMLRLPWLRVARNDGFMTLLPCFAIAPDKRCPE